MGIAFGSINTGLPKDIVQQIMKAERMPLASMEARKGKDDNKKKLVDELSGLVEGIRGHLAQNATARSLREFKHDGRDDLVGLTIDKAVALPGTYQLEVMQLAQKSSAMTSGFEDPDDSYIGVAILNINFLMGKTKRFMSTQIMHHCAKWQD